MLMRLDHCRDGLSFPLVLLTCVLYLVSVSLAALDSTRKVFARSSSFAPPFMLRDCSCQRELIQLQGRLMSMMELHTPFTISLASSSVTPFNFER